MHANLGRHVAAVIQSLFIMHNILNRTKMCHLEKEKLLAVSINIAYSNIALSHKTSERQTI